MITCTLRTGHRLQQKKLPGNPGSFSEYRPNGLLRKNSALNSEAIRGLKRQMY